MKKFLNKFYKNSEKIISDSGIGKYKTVQKGGRWIRSLLKSNFVEIEGHKMHLDPLDSLKLSINKSYEEFETKLVKDIIKDGNIVVDIGANIGYFTLIFARLVGEKGKVFAFEPEPNNFNLLKKNIEINGYKNVNLINKAVSNKSGKIKLYIDNVNYGGHSLIAEIPNRQSIEIESIKLDDFFSANKKIDFIKIDVEGAELEVLKGMSNLLNQKDDIKILLEFNPLMLKSFGVTTQEYVNLLIRFNFKIYELDKKTENLKQIKSQHDLTKIKLGNWINLLCIKSNLK